MPIALINEFRDDKISFSLKWQVSEHDYDLFPLTEAFGPTHIDTIRVDFCEGNPNGKHLTFYANDKLVNSYAGKTSDGTPILKECFRPRYLFPRPHCIGAQFGLILRPRFAARFVPQPERDSIYSKLYSSEEALLRLASLWAETRNDLDLNKLWPLEAISPRSELTVAEIEERLKEVSQAVNKELQKWWQDPPDLVFNAHLGGGQSGKQFSNKTNRYIVQWEVSDESNTRFHGTGLQWFVTLLVQLLLIDLEKLPVVLLLDEPAVNLHPSAQRIVAKLLDAYSE